MKKQIFIAVVLLTGIFASNNSFAHCEVPCGIYNDHLRVKQLYEHFTTIEKSMNQIEALQAKEDKNYNQIVRWVTTKEDHAKKVQRIVEQYFMHQRIKMKENSNEEAYDQYVKQITLAHKLVVYAMKTKQTTDQKYVKKLRDTLEAFEKAYFSKEDMKHMEEHHEKK
ncbi:MAG: superoxide dismutase, Ni [Bacteroidales bacterium]|nr:superoxide dismutase, Ni [Bacteroidales bacterium]